MAEKKKPVRKATVVSPSRRGEGSKVKRPASTSAKTVARGRATIKKKSAEGPKRSTANIYTNPRVVEAGVGNIPMTVARGVAAVGKKIKSQTPSAKQSAAKARLEAANARIAQQKRMMAAEDRMKSSAAGSPKGYNAITEWNKRNTAAIKEYSAEKQRYEAMVKAYKSKKK